MAASAEIRAVDGVPIEEGGGPVLSNQGVKNAQKAYVLILIIFNHQVS